jgi:hypothetical protein
VELLPSGRRVVVLLLLQLHLLPLCKGLVWWLLLLFD